MGNSGSWLGEGSTDSTEVAHYYDEWAESYNSSLAEWEYVAPQRAAELLKKHTPLTGTVLDAGCGTGLTGEALKRVGFDDLVGSDISPTSVEKARSTGCYRDVAVVDMQELPLPFADDGFAAVNCVGVLTYIDAREQLMREFARITKSDGVLAFTHRSDLAADGSFQGMLDGLEQEGLIEKIAVSEPAPYLPKNEDFADKILVIYYLYRVR